MYQSLTLYHSVFRWVVLLALLYAFFRAVSGYLRKAPFTAADNAARHWSAKAAHVQLLLGILLYSQSPQVRYFWVHRREMDPGLEVLFFPLVHLLCMLFAIVLITVASALARRRNPDRDKFRIIAWGYGLGLLLILCAIPWPFAPWASRPLIR